MSSITCLSPLRFYDSIAKQNHRKSYAFGHISPLITRANSLAPFQIVLPEKAPYSLVDARIYDANTDEVWSKHSSNVAEDLIQRGLIFRSIEGYTVVQFPGVYPFDAVTFEGEFYLALRFRKNNTSEYIWLYSEIFCCTNNVQDCLELEYWNPENDFYLKNGVISLPENFHFKMLLKAEIGKPEYPYQEESVSRLGYTFIESQVSKKTYRFNTVIPEYLCDALRIVRLCSNKVIRSRDEEYDAITFDMEVDWQTQGDLASVTCEFEVDDVLTNIGGYKYTKPGGDFNNDYNNDFDKE